MVAALLVWAPWKESAPGAPRSVHAGSPTATSIQISWTPGGGTQAKAFLVLRDGRQVASVPASARSYVDRGLRPGIKHRYTVVAQAGSHRSAASAAAEATTTTPAPVGLTAGAVTASTLAFRWSPPPGSPPPDWYVISRDGTVLKGGAVEGKISSFVDTGLRPATAYRYDVSAIWTTGSVDAVSDSSQSLTMKTSAALPVSAARLTGPHLINFKVVNTTSSVTVGTAWSNTWTFTPACPSGPCGVSVAGVMAPAGYTSHSFTMNLVRNGASYTGSTTAHITHCGQAPNIVDVQNAITVNLTVTSAETTGPTWAARALTGSIQISSPYTVAGQFACAPQSFTSSISAS